MLATKCNINLDSTLLGGPKDACMVDDRREKVSQSTDSTLYMSNPEECEREQGQWWCYWQTAGTADGIDADCWHQKFVNKEQEGGREKGIEGISSVNTGV